MKPSELTNEELANTLDEFANAYHNDSDKSILRAAARRLRQVTVRTDNSAAIAELQRRLKVAEDALAACKNAMCNYCRSTPEAHGLPCVNGCETLAMAKNALAAIRGEGGAK